MDNGAKRSLLDELVNELRICPQEPNPIDCEGCEHWTDHGVYSHECELRSEADRLGVEL